MAENFVAVLRQLVQRKVALQERERQLGRKEQQILETLGKLLPRIGYRIVAAGTEGSVLTQSRRARKVVKPLKPKRITCPKCDRRFAHPLPLARHLSATHGIRKAQKKPAKKAK